MQVYGQQEILKINVHKPAKVCRCMDSFSVHRKLSINLLRSAGLCTVTKVHRKVSIHLPRPSRFVFETENRPYTCRGLAGLNTHPQGKNLGTPKTVHKPAKVCRFVTEQEKKSRYTENCPYTCRGLAGL